MGADEMTKIGKKYWVWLSCALGAKAKTNKIFTAFKNPLEIYEADTQKRENSGVFTPKQREKLSKLTLDDAERIVSLCERNGWDIVTPEDFEYPAGLRKINNMPLVLYVDGDITCLRGKVMIGVVGTRNPGIDGITVTHNICTDLAAAGAVIVSGGALGIDSAAHESALYADGKTVCVLGCGFGTNYLMSNEAMRREISKNGALVSELPPYTPASKATFPSRNRIISGMSHAVLVVEAGERSGSLITAKAAIAQGRDVFAVPGNVLSSAYTGANRLIADGAKAAVCANDILKSFAIKYPDRLRLELIGTIEYREKEETKETPPGLDPAMEKVYNSLGNEPLHFDDIVAAAGLSQSQTVTALMQLELAGHIKQTESKKYIIN